MANKINTNKFKSKIFGIIMIGLLTIFTYPAKPAKAELDYQCAGQKLAEYMNALCNAGLPSNVKLLSPAFNMTSYTFNGIVNGMKAAGANFDCLTGIAGNVYHVSNQPVSHYMQNVRAQFSGKTFYITETGYHDTRPADFLDVMIAELNQEKSKGDIAAALWFNALNTNPGWTKFALTADESQTLTAGIGSIAGVNFATGFKTGNYSLAQTLGYHWALEIANSGSAGSVANAINETSMNVIVRIGVGSDSGGFDDPLVYAEFLKQVSTDVGGKTFYAIAGPNEPGDETWAIPDCGVAGPGPMSACGSPSGRQPIAHPGEVMDMDNPWVIIGRVGRGGIHYKEDPGKLSGIFTLKGAPTYPHTNTHNPMEVLYLDTPSTIVQNEQQFKAGSWLRSIIPKIKVEEYTSAGLSSIEYRYPDEDSASFLQRFSPDEKATLDAPRFLGCLQKDGDATGIPFTFEGGMDYDLPDTLRNTVRATNFLYNEFVKLPKPPTGKTVYTPDSSGTAQNFMYYTQDNKSQKKEDNPFEPKEVKAANGIYTLDQSLTLTATGANGVYNIGYKYCISRHDPCSLRDVQSTINGVEVGIWTPIIGESGCDTHLAPGYGAAPFLVGVSLPFTVNIHTHGGIVGPSAPGQCPQTADIQCTISEDSANPGKLTSTCGEIAEPRPVVCSDCETWSPFCGKVPGVSLTSEPMCVEGECTAQVINEDPDASICKKTGSDWVSCVIDGNITRCLQDVFDCIFAPRYKLYVQPITWVNKYREITDWTTEGLHAALTKMPGVTDSKFTPEFAKELTSFTLSINKLAGDELRIDPPSDTTRSSYIPFIRYADRIRTFCLTQKAVNVGFPPEYQEYCNKVGVGQTVKGEDLFADNETENNNLANNQGTSANFDTRQEWPDSQQADTVNQSYESTNADFDFATGVAYLFDKYNIKNQEQLQNPPPGLIEEINILAQTYR